MISLGLFLSIPLFVYEIIHIRHIFVLAIAVISIIVIFLLLQFFFRLKKTEDKLVILSQITDFSATLCGFFFFKDILYEQHPVSRAIIQVKPFLFPIVKLLFAFLFLWLVDKLIKEQEERTYTKLLIIILGFLTGLRDLLTISLLS